MTQFFIKYKTIILLFLIGLSRIMGFAQTIPLNNIPSPEIASQGLQESIPVSLFTGTPEISIPLYTLRTGGYSLPLTANYHLADVKPDNQGGLLGIGWSLSAGGYITRTVRGVADEMTGTNGFHNGYYFNAYRQPTVLQSGYSHLLDNLQGNTFYELTPDEFSFSFCGYSGTFYYSPEGWRVASDYDIKVEFDSSTGFLSFNELRSPIGTENGYHYKTYNNCFFNIFTLVTPDGTRYTFGGKNATEYSVEYYNRASSPIVATTWMLSEIRTIDNRVVNFIYDTSQFHYNIKYVPQSVQGPINNCNEHCNGFSKIVSGINAYCGFLVFPVALSTISTENEEVRLTYTPDRDYGKRLPDKARFNPEKNPLNSLNPFPTSAEGQSTDANFSLFTGYSIWGTNNQEKLSCVRDFFMKKYLGYFDIVNRNNTTDTLMSVNFGYDTGGVSSLRNRNRTRLRFIGRKYTSLNEQTHSDSYSLGYYDSGNNYEGEHFAYYDTDDWGYANGNKIVLSATPLFTPKSPNLEATKAETLKYIILPTKGKVYFDYELHRYSKEVTSNYTLQNSSGTAGGLRLARQTLCSRNQDTLCIKDYKYTNELGGSATSSGILSHRINKTMSIYFKGSTSIFKSEGGFQAPITNQNTPTVAYSCVYEINKDREGNVLDYTKYIYSNFGADIHGQSHSDQAPLFSSNFSTLYVPCTSNSVERGKLLSKTVFDNNNDTVSMSEYYYSLTNHPAMTTIYQQSMVAHCEHLVWNIIDAAWVTNTQMHRYLLSKEKHCKYSWNCRLFSKETEYEYNCHKCISRKKEKTSRGNTMTTEYCYTSDMPNNTPFVEGHILSMPYTERRIHEGNIWLMRNDYLINGFGVPYINRNTTLTPGGASTENHVTTLVDNYGNPLEMIMPDGTYYSFLWSHNGQTLAAVIKNVNRNQLLASVNISSINNLGIVDLKQKHILWNNSLPDAQIDFYSYDKNLDMTCHINPYGKVEYFTYDTKRRLSSSGIYRKNVNFSQYPLTPLGIQSMTLDPYIPQPENMLYMRQLQKTYNYNN